MEGCDDKAVLNRDHGCHVWWTRLYCFEKFVGGMCSFCMFSYNNHDPSEAL